MSRMTDIDFLPESVRQSRRRRRSMIRQGNLLGVLLVLLIALGVTFRQRVRTASGELTLLEDRTSNVQQQMLLKKRLEKERAQLLITQSINDQLGSRVGARQVMSELQRVLPESITLTNLTMEVRDQAAPRGRLPVRNQRAVGAAPRAKTDRVRRIHLTLTGVAPHDVDVANFIGRLSSSDVFEDVNMGYTKTVVFRREIHTASKTPVYEQREGREFQASCLVAK